MNDYIRTARLLARLGVEGVKIHPLHVLKGTVLHERYDEGRFALHTREQYVEAVVRFLEHLPAEVIIHRLTAERDRDVLIAPSWCHEKTALLASIEARLVERNTWQGKHANQAHSGRG